MTRKRAGLILFFFSSVYLSSYAQKQPVDYVNPFIGVLDNGSYCTVGPQLPFGSVNPGPQTPDGGHDGYAPDQPIRGFAQLHVSGTGWGKYGQFLISPQVGLNVTETGHDSPKSNEEAKPYKYSVALNRYKVQVELAPSFHCVLHKFNFPKTNEAHILVDITHSLVRDIMPMVRGNVLDGDIRIDSIHKDRITGYGSYDGGFGDGKYKIYFCAMFSKKASDYGTWKENEVNGAAHQSMDSNNQRIGAFLRFSTNEGEAVYMKIGISFKSIVQAEKWLQQEIPAWDIKGLEQRSKMTWNRELSKIKVEGGTEKDKTLFYSALYRCMLMPRNRTGDMAGWPARTMLWDDHYAVWDTWRTLFPLMAIINPGMVRDNVNAFINRFEKNHIAKDAFIAGNDMYKEQGGNDVDNIIADAYAKNIQGINWSRAYRLLKFDADSGRLGVQENDQPFNPDQAQYKARGWIPADTMSCSVSLEYAYNDFVAAGVAKGLGRVEDYRRWMKRSGGWTSLWNPEMESLGYKGFICPRNKDGSWVSIDATKNWGSWNLYFYEANAWTYSFFVPHDPGKLISLCGSAKNFADRLNYGFSHELIAYWNEPAFLASQLFHHAGRPDLSSYWTKKMMNEKYTEEGYPGNEDSGAMGSWYIFAALGFFPNAGQDFYYLNGPTFAKIILQLGNGKKLSIEAKNLSKENIYIKSCSLNGKKISGTMITHAQLMKGGVLQFEMESSN